MATSLWKLIMVLACINVVLFISGVRVIDDNYDFMDRFISVDDYNDDGLLIVSDQIKNTVPGGEDNPLQRSGSGLLEFIDSIGAVTRTLTFLVNLLFTPFGLFLGGGLPPVLGLMIGMPMLVGTFVGIAYFVRSGA